MVGKGGYCCLHLKGDKTKRGISNTGASRKQERVTHFGYLPCTHDVYMFINKLLLVFLLVYLLLQESRPRSQKDRKKIIFLPLEFLVTQMGPAGTLPLLQSWQMGSLEIWQKLSKGKSSYQSPLSWIFVSSARPREQSKNSVLFLPFQTQLSELLCKNEFFQ